jgi:2-polyprenyl-3-methyl-5-hydroxy-6-metoxy-1,4-benzoquinol methylase
MTGPRDRTRFESAPYVFGHSEVELRRLAVQAELIDPVTRRLLVEAGVTRGMRVLDVGTGRGDVAFLIAELVGETGSVVGVDRAPPAVAVARERAERSSLVNVSFVEGDPAELTFAAPFDAVVGRYVLQFQPEPSVMLRRVVTHLVPGGTVAFHEIDWTGYRSYPPVALWDRCCGLVLQALEAGGADTHSGSKLPSTFAAAGLPAPSMKMSAIVGAGANCGDAVRRLVGLVATLLPVIEERGLVEPREIEADTLAQRLSEDVTAGESFVVAASELTAWCRT